MSQLYKIQQILGFKITYLDYIISVSIIGLITVDG